MADPIRVFILEDNEDDFFLLKEALEASDEIRVEIFHSERFAPAIRMIEENNIDIVLLDLNLPDSTGLDTFIRLRDRFPLLPTVIFTGHKDHNLAMEAVKKGAQDYLYKGEPSATAIVRTVRYAIERQRLNNELTILRGIIPICSSCKKIRDDTGYWNLLESYLEEHSEASFSHSLCPECSDKPYGNEEWYIEMKKK